MKINSDITAERLANGKYKIVNVIEQVLDKKEMLNLVKTRQSMKENTLNKLGDLKNRKKNISKEVKTYKTKILGEITEQMVENKNSINLKAINDEVLVLNKAILGDKEMLKLEDDLNKLIKEYRGKQIKLKKESEKINTEMQKRLKKI